MNSPVRTTHQGPAAPRVLVHTTAQALAESIARRLEATIAASTASGSGTNIALTGGTIANAAYRQLSSDIVNFAGTTWWFGDERFVPAADPDRNEQQIREAFFDRCRIAESQIHAMPADTGQPAAQAAAVYAAELPTAPFDVVLLGVGPDGHVASLFPQFSQLYDKTHRCLAVHDSPKPPPTRLTLTFPTLNNATEVWFLVSGSAKAGAVASALGNGTLSDTPAVGVRGLRRTLWLIDSAAAAQLPSQVGARRS